MQVLGHSRTWRTFCFINGGCGEDCYLQRFCQVVGSSPYNLEIRSSAVAEYRDVYEKAPPALRQKATRDISRINPSDHLGAGEKLVFGYIQDYVENRAERQLRNLGTIGQQHLRATLGNNRSQITIVTSDFESYTAYADLRNVIVRRKDMVAARLRAVRVLGVADTGAAFLCDEVLVVRGHPTS